MHGDILISSHPMYVEVCPWGPNQAAEVLSAQPANPKASTQLLEEAWKIATAVAKNGKRFHQDRYGTTTVGCYLLAFHAQHAGSTHTMDVDHPTRTYRLPQGSQERDKEGVP